MKKNFKDIKGNFANLKILKCYKNIINNLKDNYGFIIIISMFILLFICMILFFCKYYYSLTIEVDNISKVIKIINNKNKNDNILMIIKKLRK